jgi:hypothetical protein
LPQPTESKEEVSPEPQEEATVSKKRGTLPQEATCLLKKWLVDHRQHSYPTEAEKMGLQNTTGLTSTQVSNWFINARRGLLPQVLKEHHDYTAVPSPTVAPSSSSKRKKKSEKSALQQGKLYQHTFFIAFH